MHHDLPLITTIAAAFTAAWVLGLITQRLRLSPIVGYLLAGIAIGPHTPGFVGDASLAPQLAELGVILLMFGVGLHFHLEDLLAVRNVALPGAVGQSLIATLLGVAVALAAGWSFKSGLVLGMAMAVASTVVLIRVLTDNRQLETTAGHVAVGWLIVEDVLTVIVLVLIPALATAAGGDGAAAATGATTAPAAAAAPGFLWTLVVALLKLAALVALLLFPGAKVIPWVMVRVARLRSRELFTLTVLVMAIAVAAASAYLFGASMALGAFLAGMVVGRSPVSHQAAADALPLRDAFAVLFFASVGMLFDPGFLLREPLLVLAGLGIVMVGKPLAALAIVALIGYPARTGLVVALGLAQIGEFSFILSEAARGNGLMTDAGHNVLVACALVSITLNPLLFRLINPLEKLLQRHPALWRFMNRRTIAREREMNEAEGRELERSDAPVAVIVGYGPVGRTLVRLLLENDIQPAVVELNMETVRRLRDEGLRAVYGDATHRETMLEAGAQRAVAVIYSSSGIHNAEEAVRIARECNPKIRVLARATYLRDVPALRRAGADAVFSGEGEVALTMTEFMLKQLGATGEQIDRAGDRIRSELFGTPQTVELLLPLPLHGATPDEKPAAE